MNLILNEDHKVGGVPYGVTEYGNNDDFIIARQSPRDLDDAIDGRQFDYRQGRDTSYYWVISKVDNALYGPMDEREFVKSQLLLGIPNGLALRSVYE